MHVYLKQLSSMNIVHPDEVYIYIYIYIKIYIYIHTYMYMSPFVEPCWGLITVHFIHIIGVMEKWQWQPTVTDVTVGSVDKTVTQNCQELVVLTYQSRDKMVDDAFLLTYICVTRLQWVNIQKASPSREHTLWYILHHTFIFILYIAGQRERHIINECFENISHYVPEMIEMSSMRRMRTNKMILNHMKWPYVCMILSITEFPLVVIKYTFNKM